MADELIVMLELIGAGYHEHVQRVYNGIGEYSAGRASDSATPWREAHWFRLSRHEN